MASRLMTITCAAKDILQIFNVLRTSDLPSDMKSIRRMYRLYLTSKDRLPHRIAGPGRRVSHRGLQSGSGRLDQRKFSHWSHKLQTVMSHRTQSRCRPSNLRKGWWGDKSQGFPESWQGLPKTCGARIPTRHTVANKLIVIPSFSRLPGILHQIRQLQARVASWTVKNDRHTLYSARCPLTNLTPIGFASV